MAVITMVVGGLCACRPGPGNPAQVAGEQALGAKCPGVKPGSSNIFTVIEFQGNAAKCEAPKDIDVPDLLSYRSAPALWIVCNPCGTALAIELTNFINKDTGLPVDPKDLFEGNPVLRLTESTNPVRPIVALVKGTAPRSKVKYTVRYTVAGQSGDIVPIDPRLEIE